MWLRRDASDTETVIDTFAGPNPAFTMLFNAHNNWVASARARVGWVADQWLLYATGGAGLDHHVLHDNGYRIDDPSQPSGRDQHDRRA
jgi:hypothetical protein